MKTLCHLVGDILHHGPSDTVDRLTPWIISVLGIGMLALMAYAWWP